MPVLSDKGFKNDVKTGIAVVRFYSLWDSYSRASEEQFRQLSDEFRGKAKFIESDIHANPELAQNLLIRKVPSVLVFINGKLVGREEGISSKRRLKERIEHLIERAGMLR